MATVKTYAAGRLLNMPGNKVREPGYYLIGSGDYERGQLVPEAHVILRLDSYLHSGHLDEVEVEEEEFRAAIAEYCPELEEEILARVGLTGDGVLYGTESSPHLQPSIEELAAAGQLPAEQVEALEEEAAEEEVAAEQLADNVCPVCGETFKTAAGMKSHRTRMHPE